ncbi:MAG TPA: MFS transporter [Thermoanaerobaculia bacterium]|nr:MFS transporter [Thermoanaerobaculia bacterium]
MSTQAPSSPGRAALFAVYATVFLDLLGFGILLPALPYYAERLGASGTGVALLFASYSLAQLVGANLLGRLSDARGRRPVLLLSLVGSALGMTASGLAQSLLTLCAARALAGLSGGSIGTAQAFIADTTTPEQRPARMGGLGASIGLGFVAGPALGALLLGRGLGFAGAAFTAAALALANLVFTFLVLPESRRPGAAPTASRGLAAWRTAVSRPVLRPVLAASFLVLAAFVAMETTFALWTEERFGFREREFGLVLTLAGAVMVIVQGALVGPISRRFGVRRVAAAGGALLGLALAAMPWAPGKAWLLANVVVMALGLGLALPSLSSLLSQLSPAEDQGTVLGAGQSLQALARATGPLAAGLLFDLGPALPYLWAGGLGLLAAWVVGRGSYSTVPVNTARATEK